MKSSWFFLFTILIALGLVLCALGCGDDNPANSGDENTIETGSVTDLDGNVYATVKIGNQWWMAENLRVTHYRNGDEINVITDNTGWFETRVGACCSYNNSDTIIDTYGRIYNSYAVVDSRKIAPAGWHVASDSEWQTLIGFVGDYYTAGGKLKQRGTNHWRSPNTGASDEYGFTALPGGQRMPAGHFDRMEEEAYFWTSSYLNATTVLNTSLSYRSAEILRGGSWPYAGKSVRCVKD
ncbi:MAG: fibrobacter succinogenes major paralogous domain-containing protein [candidate division Zixibacteria bacterium]|nr:fibrobacter succinogenes major paralogous domain-containing protein [candidate division Zixibacteria bacterium]